MRDLLSCLNDFKLLISSYNELYFIYYDFRSDAQRAAKQKEAKERELEQCSFSAERIEEGGFPLSMVRKKTLSSTPCNFNETEYVHDPSFS